jgi:hypothetical protein
MRLMLYNKSMLVNIAVSLVGVVIFLFMFWRRLKDDYSSEIIFSSAEYILLGIALGWLAAFKFIPNWFFWTTILGGMIGLTVAVFRFRVRFYEFLEAFTISLLPWIGFIFLEDSVTNSSLSSFLAFVAILIIIFISYWLNVNYRSFIWYKSGRIGFTGLATAGILFVLRSVVAAIGINVVSFVAGYETLISAAAALVCFSLLFNLGKIKK